VRILYLAASAFPLRQARAIQIAHTVAALAERGHAITLVVGGLGGASLAASFGAYGLSPPPGVRLARLPAWQPPVQSGSRWTGPASRAWVATHLAALALALPVLTARAEYDFVFARTLRVAALAQRLPRVRRLPLVFELHFLDSLNAEAERRGRRHVQGLRRLERRVLRGADRVVTLTTPARALVLERFGVPPARVAVIPSGTAPEEVGDPGAAREPGLVVYAGQLQDWKGVSVLLDALALAPAARLQIIGGTAESGATDAQRAALAERAAALGVGARLELLGPLPYPEVQRRLRCAQVAAIPLRDTPIGRLFTSPLKAFDYMQAGAAIVASDLPALRDVLTPDVNALLVPPEQPAPLAAAISRLLGDAALRQRLARQARQDVRAFTWQARAARLEQLLLDCLAARRDAAAAGAHPIRRDA